MKPKCKYRVVIATILVALFICACGQQGVSDVSAQPEDREADADVTPTPDRSDPYTIKTGWFTFSKTDEMLLPAGGLPLEDLIGVNHTQEYEAEFWGRCIRLFGEAYSKEQNYENMFSYNIWARAEGYEDIPLEIYFGPSGPSIAFNDDTIDLIAAKELAKVIMKASPADYDWISSYNDLNIRIAMGVKKGKPYYETLVPGATMEMSRNQREEMAKNFFGRQCHPYFSTDYF